MAVTLTLTNEGRSWIAARIAANSPAEIDKVALYTGQPSNIPSLTGSALGTAGKEFTALNSDTAADGEFIVSARDNSSDAYSYPTVVALAGAVAVGAYTSTPAFITKTATRDLVIEVGLQVSGTPLSPADFTVTGVNRATDARHGTVRLMTDAEVGAQGAAAAVPTGDDVATMIERGAIPPASRFTRLTSTGDGVWTKPDGASIFLVEVIGGGASGGSLAAAGRRGGGAGLRFRTLYQASALPATVNYHVAAGRAAVAGAAGQNGNETRFGDHPLAVRGFGGEANEDLSGVSAFQQFLSRTGFLWGRGGDIGNHGYATPFQNGGARGTSAIDPLDKGRDGGDSDYGLGSGGGGSHTANGGGGDGGVPGGGGGGGFAKGGDGARGEIRIWAF